MRIPVDIYSTHVFLWGLAFWGQFWSRDGFLILAINDITGGSMGGGEKGTLYIVHYYHQHLIHLSPDFDSTGFVFIFFGPMKQILLFGSRTE